MKKVLETLLKNLVSQPEAVSINETDNGREVILEISAAKEDMGRIIGKEGKIIQALRNVLKIKAIKEGKRVEITLKEPQP
ncbi:MAG: KH domain-containing protein [Patescibacteria group bacterium]|nr:KH domain-containing protein [Patescibacteria group bacterium]